MTNEHCIRIDCIHFRASHMNMHVCARVYVLKWQHYVSKVEEEEEKNNKAALRLCHSPLLFAIVIVVIYFIHSTFKCDSIQALFVQNRMNERMNV